MSIGLPPHRGAYPQPPSPFEGRLEPEARNARDSLTAAAISAAVSLKRIADAFDGTTLGVDISESLAGMGNRR